jgi:hypothetical protein
MFLRTKLDLTPVHCFNVALAKDVSVVVPVVMRSAANKLVGSTDPLILCPQQLTVAMSIHYSDDHIDIHVGSPFRPFTSDLDNTVWFQFATEQWVRS